MLILPWVGFAQTQTTITVKLTGKAIKFINGINKDDKVELLEIATTNQITNITLHSLENDEYYYPHYSAIKKVKFDYNTINDFWKVNALVNKAYKNLSANGYQYDIRKEMEEEAIDYLNLLDQYNLLFNDTYLEHYLYSLVYKIYPEKLDDKRPGNINIKILKNPSPNAAMLPNGTMLINTGLLSLVNSEAELLAVMAHEVAHFVLDHAIINRNKAIQRKKRAEFWAGVATAAAAVGEAYMASQDANYAPGAITAETMIAAYSIAESINTRLGLKFTQSQEFAADKASKDLFKFLKMDTTALGSVLSKIRNYSIITGNYLALTGSGNHPAIDERIKIIGLSVLEPDTTYDKIISQVISYNASIEMRYHHLEACENLVKRNIASHVACENDYLLLAQAYIYQYDTESKNKEALELIQTAKTLNIYPTILLDKYEGLIQLRLKNKTEAKKVLTEYKNSLNKIRQDNHNKNIYSSRLEDEFEWVNKMIGKIDVL